MGSVFPFIVGFDRKSVKVLQHADSSDVGKLTDEKNEELQSEGTVDEILQGGKKK